MICNVNEPATVNRQSFSDTVKTHVYICFFGFFHYCLDFSNNCSLSRLGGSGARSSMMSKPPAADDDGGD